MVFAIAHMFMYQVCLMYLDNLVGEDVEISIHHHQPFDYIQLMLWHTRMVLYLRKSNTKDVLSFWNVVNGMFQVGNLDLNFHNPTREQCHPIYFDDEVIINYLIQHLIFELIQRNLMLNLLDYILLDMAIDVFVVLLRRVVHINMNLGFLLFWDQLRSMD